MKKLIFSNWHFMRWVRLVAGLAMAYHAISTESYFFLFFAGFFLIQALFDIGCGANGCSVPKSN